MNDTVAEIEQVAPPKLLVPAYFHPALEPEQWAMMADRAEQVQMVILNVNDGPGERRDEARLEALERLLEAGVAVAGYVDVDYGQRPRHDVVADIGCFMLWYRVTGIFFDRVPAAPDQVPAAALLARHARDIGAQSVIFHHGVYPAEAYAEHADILGTFEGPWSSYVDLPVPRWARELTDAKSYHVVYSVPPASFGDAVLLANRRRAGYVYITDHEGANPYERLPADWLDAAAG